MSSQRGNLKKSGPKHQNDFAFKHNKKSKKTEKIRNMPIEGLCSRCHDQMIWRKKYRKYKPLTQPGTCQQCHQKTILSAYHMICRPCAKNMKCCAKCRQEHSKDPANGQNEEDKEEETSTEDESEDIEGMDETNEMNENDENVVNDK